MRNIRDLVLTGLVALPLALAAGTAGAADTASRIEAGKKIAFDRKQGNCLACHVIADGVSPGTIAPPLVAMKVRFPDKAKLRAQIWDPMKNNPETSMPPFGRHEVLTEAEIDSVVEFIWSL